MNRSALAARALATVLVLGLAACNQGQKDAGGKAEGEVLPGSVSDAMLPYDQVKSQPPLAPASGDAKAKGKQTSGEKSDSASSAPEPDASASAAAPAPSASETPEE